jgi:hypothetical protein
MLAYVHTVLYPIGQDLSAQVTTKQTWEVEV